MYDELVKRLRTAQTPAEFVAEETAKMPNTIFGEAADAIEELQGRFYMMKKTAEWLGEHVPRWISVEERLPSENGRYLTVSIEPWFGTTVVDNMRWSGVWMYDGRQVEAKVTHWMPLPEPPKEET